MGRPKVLARRLPHCPTRDSRYTVKHHNGEWRVHYDHRVADEPHAELVGVINDVKEQVVHKPGGAFMLTEHSQVVVVTGNPAGGPPNSFHVAILQSGALYTYPQLITFDGGMCDPSAEPAFSAAWPGPRCGSTYRFAAPNSAKAPSQKYDEIWLDSDDGRKFLSIEAKISPYPPSNGALAEFLHKLRTLLPDGGRFRVNQHCRAFTSDRTLFIGTIDLDWWFPLLAP